ncbi:hypothetical protein Tco_1142228 [Tanacetum coccineum]
MDENAIANLHLALADGVLSRIDEKKSAKEIWDRLARLYEANSLQNKIFLKRKSYALHMTESTSVTEHINSLNTIFSQLTSLIFDDVSAAILEEENRRNNREDRQTSPRQVKALVVTRGRSTEHGPSGSHGKFKSGGKKGYKCYKCGPSPQPQALGTTFEARIRDYTGAHSERMDRFENVIFKQQEEINGKMIEMFGLLKELMTSRAPKKVLVRGEAKFCITKNVNSISLARGEGERNDETNEILDNTEMPTEIKIPVKEVKMNNEVECEPIKMAEEKETT